MPRNVEATETAPIVQEGDLNNDKNRVRVLYSFPHRLGAGRICYTAWQQVNGVAQAGADVLAFVGSLSRPVSTGVRVKPTLAIGKLRIPYRLVGSRRAFAIHDYLVARSLPKLQGKVDIVHTWSLGAMRTLESAARLGIPTVLERPNAHTRFAYQVVQQECERLGITLPRGHEHAYNADVLRIEEQEYDLATHLLCPSDFVRQTFLDRGFGQEKLLRHQYGYDEHLYYPATTRSSQTDRGLKVLFVGVCAVRKGLHFALEAWLRSTAHRTGTFQIAGAFVPAYAERLSHLLNHPSIEVLGHRNDVSELMRKSDILILPSIEEGSALVTSEARGSGCVLLVSEASGAPCRHMENALVHPVGDVEALAEHLSMVDRNRDFLETLRSASLRTSPEITWQAAGTKLLEVYRTVIANQPTPVAALEPLTHSV